ncbi:hypothetical protein B7463_g8183, partial [Scytalidium lignicola]
MASARLHKRPYAGSQPAITSYFSSAPQSKSTTTPSTQASSPASFPELPATVQSNLLSVGMRVRKSVPEGYKTGSAYSAFSIFTDSTPVNAQLHNTPPSAIENNDPPILAARKPRRSGITELTPFCGILKVGGLSQQWCVDEPTVLEDEEDTDEVNDVPFLSSQGSTISTLSVGSVACNVTNKRRYPGEDDEDGIQVVSGGVIPVSADFRGRVIAVPRRKKGQVTGAEVFAQGSAIDFEDADFLDYSSYEEVEMRDY